MRLPRFLLAGVLLFAAVLTLTALFAPPSYPATSATAAVVFLPLWYAVAAVNAGIGVLSAGYRISQEVGVFALVFGIPAVLVALTWWASAAFWQGGPTIHTGRTPFVLVAGLTLWAAITILAGLLTPAHTTGTAALVFVPLWLLVSTANTLLGLHTGHPLAQEITLFLLTTAIPVTIAITIWNTPLRPRIRRTRLSAESSP